MTGRWGRDVTALAARLVGRSDHGLVGAKISDRMKNRQLVDRKLEWFELVAVATGLYLLRCRAVVRRNSVWNSTLKFRICLTIPTSATLPGYRLHHSSGRLPRP